MATLMQIGELAERTGLSLRTIRHYDDEGLLTPSARSAGGFRLYSAHDLDRLMVIRTMKPLGFSIEEMHDLLATVSELGSPGDRRADLDARLAGFVASAVGRREKLRSQLAMADEFIETLHGFARG
ncbi:MAG: MerR family transcriptional regulator [Nakamurella sp.]